MHLAFHFYNTSWKPFEWAVTKCEDLRLTADGHVSVLPSPGKLPPNEPRRMEGTLQLNATRTKKLDSRLTRQPRFLNRHSWFRSRAGQPPLRVRELLEDSGKDETLTFPSSLPLAVSQCVGQLRIQMTFTMSRRNRDRESGPSQKRWITPSFILPILCRRARCGFPDRYESEVPEGRQLI